MMIEDAELQAIYDFSCKERLQKLRDGLLRLENDPDDARTAEELRREIHSLKGDSRSVGLDTIGLLSQEVESVLKSILRQEIALSSALRDRLLQGLRVIESLIQEAVTGQPSHVDVEQAITQFATILSSPSPSFLSSPLSPPSEERIDFSPATEPLKAPLFIEDEDLREIYQITSLDRLHQLEVGLLELTMSPDEETTLAELLRQIHSLKGDSSSIGLEPIVLLAEKIELILKAIQQQELCLTSFVNDCLYQGLAAFEQLVHEAITGEPSQVEMEQILGLLEEAMSQPPTPQSITVGESILAPTPTSSVLIEEDQELREIYRVTSEDRLLTLETSLNELANQSDATAVLETMRRQIHSLKGDSRSVGLDDVAMIAQQLENIIKHLENQELSFTVEVSNGLSQGLNGVRELVYEAVTGIPSGVNVDQVLNPLIAISDLSVLAEETATPGNIPSSTQPKEIVAAESPDSTLVIQIEDVELRELYRATSEERLQRLETGLLHLERHPNNSIMLAELMREAHSLKGDSRTAGVETVEVISHQFEDVLGYIQRQAINLTDVGDRLYQSLDAMRQLVHTAVTGQPSLLDPTPVLNQLSELSEIAAASVMPEVETIPSIPSDLPSSPQPIAEPSLTDTIRVPTRNLDVLSVQAEELTITRIQLAQTTEQAQRVEILWQEWKANRQREQTLISDFFSADSYADRLEELMSELRRSVEENAIKLEQVTKELTDNIRTLRLLPLSTVFQTFPRMVRDLAKQQAKSVELSIEGGELSVDKQLLEGIKDALLHLIRNAIDHGIETVSEREKLGKPAIATIRLKGYQTANSVVIEVSDDGRGLDVEKIKQTAIRRKLHTPNELEKMTPSQIYGLIMTSGFSTRTFITEISGRGVGLDVVRTNVERLKGNIQIESTPRQGCTFRLQLSTTLTTSNVIFLDVQGIIHAIPFEFLQTTLVVLPEQVELREGREMLQLNDQFIPVANLIDVLELIHSPAYALANKLQQSKSERLSCVVLQVGEEQAGFFVDRLLDTQEVVLKPQSPILKRVRNVMGATTLGTGEICMILNPSDLIRSLQKPVQVKSDTRLPEPTRNQSVILLVEDSLPVRTQEKRLLESAGYKVVLAVDGLDGYNKLKTQKFDAVVSDIEMPNLDGLSLTEKIRQDRNYDELPIILVTTLSSEEDRKRGAEAGANAYIAKGKFNQQVLLETLTKLI
jgi:two-component system chemotaxis sensor kinase CheA